jgi:hypothetical protein
MEPKANGLTLNLGPGEETEGTFTVDLPADMLTAPTCSFWWTAFPTNRSACAFRVTSRNEEPLKIAPPREGEDGPVCCKYNTAFRNNPFNDEYARSTRPTTCNPLRRTPK